MHSFNSLLIFGLVSAVQASPFNIDRSKDASLSPRWEAPTIPQDWIDKSNETTGEQLISKYGQSSDAALQHRVCNSEPKCVPCIGVLPTNPSPSPQASGCSQGTCPDRDAPFSSDTQWDLIFQFTVIPQPDFPLFTQEMHLRHDNCDGTCGRTKVGLLGAENSCHNIRTCNRDQIWCVDERNKIMSREYKDNGAKEC